MAPPYVFRKLQDVAPVACPCGQARRNITDSDNDQMSEHRVTITGAAKVNYHESLTE